MSAVLISELQTAFKLHQDKNYNKALQIYLELINKDHNNSQVNQCLAILYTDTAQYDKAKYYHDKSIELEPSNYFYYYNYACYHNAIKNYETSIKLLETALKLNNNYPKAICLLAENYYNLSLYDQAVHFFSHLDLTQNSYSIDIKIKFLYSILKIYQSKNNDLNNLFYKTYNNLIKNFEQETITNKIAILNLINEICDFNNEFNNKNYTKDYFSTNKINNIISSAIIQNIRYSKYEGLSKTIILNYAAIEQEISYFKNYHRSIQDNIFCKNKLFDHNIANIIDKNNSINKIRSKINLGYLAQDFFKISTAELLHNIFINHDQNKFNIFIYNLEPELKSNQKLNNKNNIYNKYIKNYKKYNINYINLSNKNHLDIAKHIYLDNINILIKIKDYRPFRFEEVFALKPAPIQIEYLSTTPCNSEYIDYLIADNTVVPDKDNLFYNKNKLIKLNTSYHPRYNYKQFDVEFKKNNLQKNILFGSINVHNKISIEYLDAISSILNKVKNSKIVFIYENEISKINIINYLSNKNIENTRIIFWHKIDKISHIKRLENIDIHLDTFICSGHTTSMDLLYSNVPIITLYGNKFHSRVTASLLKEFELDNLIAYSVEEYISKSIEFANNINKYNLVKNNLIKNKINFFNPRNHTKKIEDELIKIFDYYLKKPYKYRINQPKSNNNSLSIIMPYYRKFLEFATIFKYYNYFNFRQFIQNNPQTKLELIIAADDPRETTELINYINNFKSNNKLNFDIKICINYQEHSWRPPCIAINNGIFYASGGKIIIISPESILPSDSIEKLINNCDDKNFSVGLVNFYNKNIISNIKPNNKSIEQLLKYNNIYQAIYYGSICCTRDNIINIGGYNEGFKSWGGDDDDIRARLIKYNINQVYTKARVIHTSFNNRDYNKYKINNNISNNIITNLSTVNNNFDLEQSGYNLFTNSNFKLINLN